jgi:hypothetical protein
MNDVINALEPKVVAVILGCLLVAMPCAISAQENQPFADTRIVWSEKENGQFKVFTSRFENDSWSERIQLSLPTQSAVYPSISSGPNGTTWVVWTVLKGNNSDLYFTTSLKEGEWAEPTQIITNLSSNSAAMILVDRTSSPWVVWSGFDGQDDEIFFTRWNGTDWDFPLMINDDNSTPDIIPSLTLNDEGFPVVRWLGFADDGYLLLAKEWNGFSWDEIIVDKSQDPFDPTTPRSVCKLPDLPAYIKNKAKAAIDYNCGKNRQSYRLGNMRQLKY